jgi:hypothetical protein
MGRSLQLLISFTKASRGLLCSLHSWVLLSARFAPIRNALKKLASQPQGKTSKAISNGQKLQFFTNTVPLREGLSSPLNHLLYVNWVCREKLGLSATPAADRRRSGPNATSKHQSQPSALSSPATSPDACRVALVVNEPTYDTVRLTAQNFRNLLGWRRVAAATGPDDAVDHRHADARQVAEADRV